MPDQALMLELDHVTKRYGAIAGGTQRVVLADICMQVAVGESLAIVGPSGCGKSTLLNIIGTLDRPSSGVVRLEGRDLSLLDEKALAALRNRRIGFVFQDHHLLPQCTLMENVLLPTLVNGSTEQARPRALHLLERIGLQEHLNHRPGTLSGGQRQRAAVVRALINRPGLLLADEPTGSLDRAGAENMAQLLVELNAEENLTLISVTHAPEVARRMGRTMELRDGILTGHNP